MSWRASNEATDQELYTYHKGKSSLENTRSLIKLNNFNLVSEWVIKPDLELTDISLMNLYMSKGLTGIKFPNIYWLILKGFFAKPDLIQDPLDIYRKYNRVAHLESFKKTRTCVDLSLHAISYLLELKGYKKSAEFIKELSTKDVVRLPSELEVLLQSYIIDIKPIKIYDITQGALFERN